MPPKSQFFLPARNLFTSTRGLSALSHRSYRAAEMRGPAKLTNLQRDDREFLAAIALVAVSLWVFYPVFFGSWLWDDRETIPENTAIHRSLAGIWLDPGTTDYELPLKNTLVWLEWRVFGAHPFGYHFANFLLHLGCAFLVWKLFRKLNMAWAWFGALLFAIHPLAVGTVGWIAEQKNTSSLLFLLLATCAWVDFDAGGKKKDHLKALGFFVAALLCKSAVIMLPATLLLYAWWRRGTLSVRDLRATAPFFLVAAVFALITIWFQEHVGINTAVSHLEPTLARAAASGVTAVFYLGKFLWPVPLLAVYPRWQVEPFSLLRLVPWFVIAAGVGTAWLFRRGWGRHVLLGLGYFLLNLLPVLGFFRMSFMQFSWVSDHFAYISLIGLCGLTAAGLAGLSHRRAWVGRCALPLAVVVASACAILSQRHARVFLNEGTFWAHTLAHNPDAWVGENVLGWVALQDGRLDEAEAHFRKSIEGNPQYARSRNNLGNVLMKKGRMNDAVVELRAAVEIDPRLTAAYNNLGVVSIHEGKWDEAGGYFEQALKIDPGFASAENNLGAVYAKKGDFRKAASHFEKALASDPNFSDARENLRSAKAKLD